jgi:hypothetical protein
MLTPFYTLAQGSRWRRGARLPAALHSFFGVLVLGVCPSRRVQPKRPFVALPSRAAEEGETHRTER